MEIKVGELARRTGLSVRTLHYYEQIGLLPPPRRTPAGYRIYGAVELDHLLRVISLKQLGLSLKEVERCLRQDGFSTVAVLEGHIATLEDQIRVKQHLRKRLEGLVGWLRSSDEPDSDTIITVIQETVKMDSYYTPDQLEYLSERSEEVGQERMLEAGREWNQVFADFRENMEKGTDPADPAVQALLDKSAALMSEFTGGHPGVESSLKKMYEERGPQEVLRGYNMGVDTELTEYMAKARAVREARD